MNKLHYTHIFIVTMLFNMLSMQGMENPQHTDMHHPLINVLKPINIFSYLFLHEKHQLISLKNSIRNFMKMSITCNDFNKILTYKTIGKLCRNYAQTDKDEFLKNLLRNISVMREYQIPRPTFQECYLHNCLPALILVYAGADSNTTSNDSSYFSDTLFTRAIQQNDIYVVKKLLKHNVILNNTHMFMPPLFFSKTKKMAQVLHKFGANIDATDMGSKNILWYMVDDQYSLDLIKFYLEQGVSPKQLDLETKECLLHKVCDLSLEKITLLLDIIPELINTINTKGQTPLDLLQPNKNKEKIINMMCSNLCKALKDDEESLEEIDIEDMENLTCDDYALFFEPEAYRQERIDLLRSHGACTAQELQKL